jgi:hypothetical protein
MDRLKNTWQNMLAEPFTWIFYCFFQPARFKREFEGKDSARRLVVLLRLVLPMFLCAFLLALLLDTVVLLVLAKIYPCEVFCAISLYQFVKTSTVLAIILGILAGVLIGVVVDIAGGIAVGIAWGTILGMLWGALWTSGEQWNSIAHYIASGETATLKGSWGQPLTTSPVQGIAAALVGVLIGGLIGTIVGGLNKDMKGGLSRGLLWGFVVSFALGTLYDVKLAIIISPAAGAAGGITKLLEEKRNLSEAVAGAMVGACLGMIAGCIWWFGWLAKSTGWDAFLATFLSGAILGSVGGFMLGFATTTLERFNEGKGLVEYLMGGIAFVTAFSLIGAAEILSALIYLDSVKSSYMIFIFIMVVIALGMITSITRPVAMINGANIVGALALGYYYGVSIGGDLGGNGARLSVGLALVIVMFGMSYLCGYFRLPLYPASYVSSLKAYFTSRKNPLEVFSHLRRSSLHWDECVYLPLPGLKRTLLFAADQNTVHALEEINYILHERPQQINAARGASLEIAIRDLEGRETLRDIAQASQRLAEIFPQEAKLIDPRWVTPFARLSDASREAIRYYSPLGWQARRDALENMQVQLKLVYPHSAFSDALLNRRVGELVKQWQVAAKEGLEELELAPEKTSFVRNPYTPGSALEQRNSLFVGRRDLSQQLEDALSRGRHRPTFLLNGERRMGKSSTLMQLPDLLGARYIPLFYDLQARGISSSASTFLGTVAEEIRKGMQARGIQVKSLAYAQLMEASKENEAAVYYVIDTWLRGVERILEREDRTLLLTFDEFEKLEEAWQDGFLNLKLLLDWFRTIIQHHPRLALLFSGVRNFEDMDMNWASYFVNVQVLKVSFLQPEEAYQLITRPVPDFPGERIFHQHIIEEIMRISGCHPFLLQAVCSALIDSLNAQKRDRVEAQDVSRAAARVLKNWGMYFRDLWERTGKYERACLIALKDLGEGDLLNIAERCSLEERIVRRALENLLERDLIVLEKGNYRIGVPLLYQWVASVSHL